MTKVIENVLTFAIIYFGLENPNKAWADTKKGVNDVYNRSDLVGVYGICCVDGSVFSGFCLPGSREGGMIMEKKERNWLFFLIGIFLVVNAITLSPLVPWQEWLLWNDVEPDQTVEVEYGAYEIEMPADPVEIKVGDYVEFIATSKDVTYGFGVFRQDNTMVFQMQVLPGRENHIIWKFEEPGLYDVRSTEYSGPKHSEMYLPDAILVTE